MPDLSLLAGAVAGGSNILDVGLQSIQNAKNRKWTEKMYKQQRADALADWNMQNAYNSPSAQMERLKAANLNPHLVYGTGVQAGGIAGSVRPSSVGSYKGEAPQVNMGSAMAAYVDTKMKQQQVDVMRSIVDLNDEKKKQIIADTLMKGANTGLINTKNAAEAFKLGMANSLAEFTKESADWKVRQQQMEVTKGYTQTGLIEAQRILTQDENGRRERLTKANIDQKLVSMALMEAQADATRKGIELTDERIKQIKVDVLNALKTGTGIGIKNDLLQSELDYQTIQRAQSWIKTFVGAAKK